MKKSNNFLSPAKQALLMLALFISLLQSAQNGLTNLSFENWTITPLGASPVGWFGFNVSQKSSGAQQGNSYVRMNNANSSEGMLMLGTFTSLSGPLKGGAPYSQVPVSLNGFYKTSSMVFGDTLGITAYTSKLGAISAIGSFSQNTNVANWTSFSLVFFSFYPGPIDSLFILASSGNIFGGNANSAGATLDLDNLSLSTLTGIDKHSIGSSFIVYPNPASSALTIISKDEKAMSIIITDINGRLITEQILDGEKTTVNLLDYKKGIYFYSIVDKEKITLLTSKLIVTE